MSSRKRNSTRYFKEVSRSPTSAIFHWDMRLMMAMAWASVSRLWFSANPTGAPCPEPAWILRRQRRVRGWYARRMLRCAVAIFLSYQYQRSLSTSASATKTIGMPLSKASSTAGDISNCSWADTWIASSARSTRNWVTSAVACACASPHASHSSAPRHHKTACSSGLLLQ